MTRFFFDTAVGDKIDRDTDGVELGDDGAARIEAQAALSDMVQEGLPNGDHANFSVHVRDESGREIYTARMTLDGRPLPDWH